jgi:ubiquinol-cytochrome c reductase cytochrome b subunit
MRLSSTIGKWFDNRLQLGTPIPRETASWFNIFGTTATRVLAFQLVTGTLLALDYENGQRSFSPATEGEKQPCA